MRFSSSFVLCAVFVFCLLVTTVYAQSTLPSLFTSNLSLGSRGDAVLALQQLLNRDPATQIAASGPGSAGNETGFFGGLTKAAVVRFQIKYASEVLAPAGLASPTGYVGLNTRNKLNALLVHQPATMSSAQTPLLETESPTPSPARTLAAPAGPNARNLDVFLGAVDAVATKKGVSDADRAVIRDEIVRGAATTTDLRSTFINMVKSNASQAAADAPPMRKVLATIENVIRSLFSPEHARAATGIPFGGALTYAWYCNCSQTWLIGVTPLPPTYVTVLSYVPGSQAYLSFNIPATEWLLGEYVQPGACFFFVGKGCAPVPTEGMISPLTGSSPL